MANTSLYSDDTILQFNHNPMENANHFVELAKEIPKSKAIPLQVRREHETPYLAVRLPDREQLSL